MVSMGVMIQEILYFLTPMLLLLVGYTWVIKTEDDEVDDDHVNLLQTEKIDRDGEIPATGTQQWKKGADIASAATLVPGSDGNSFDVTGTTSITAINAVQSQPGTMICLHFDAILTLTHHATNLILPGGLNIKTAAGDEAMFIEYETNKWRCFLYTKADGSPVEFGHTPQNLLDNSGFGPWPQSDANKGISRPCAVDSGSTIPTVGETVTGAVSGATGKLKKMTGSGGNWGAGTGTGDLYLGACSPARFQDNEDLNGSASGANFATVNMPDSAAGVDLVQNGDFSVDTDPPPGWTAYGGGCSLTTEAGGQVGNCLMATCGQNEGAYAGTAAWATEVGKTYKLTWYFKLGTAATVDCYVYKDEWNIIAAETGMTDAGWTQYSITFEATTTTTSALWQKKDAGAGETFYLDEVNCYEITPCATAADNKAFDGWVKNAADLYRQHNDGGTLTKDGSFYSLEFVPTTAEGFFSLGWNTSWRNQPEWYQKFAGRTITLGMWAKTSTASHFRFSLFDGSHNWSSFHTGGGSWEWIEKTINVSASVTDFYFICRGDAAPAVNGDTIVYVSQPMLIFGSSIGEGNYKPKSQEWIWFEKAIPSNEFTGSGYSDTGSTALNVEADSDSMIPKGVDALMLYVQLNDSASATDGRTEVVFNKIGLTPMGYWISCNGVTNDFVIRDSGEVGTNSNGDLLYEIYASGANTLDLTMNYLGVKLR